MIDDACQLTKAARPDRRSVVAIGGIGGSGTRVGAALLELLGYYIGGDLNGSLDNLWFTLLFKRLAILETSDQEFEELLRLFWSRMRGRTIFSDAQLRRLDRLRKHDAFEHTKDWLAERAKSFIEIASPARADLNWGWKEPNTHLIIEKILRDRREVKYIHFERHPLDMAFSQNQNQLRNWGSSVLGRSVRLSPRDALGYWCVVHRRMDRLSGSHPKRVMLIDFDALLVNPDQHCSQLASFLDIELDSQTRVAFKNMLAPEKPKRGRLDAVDRSAFDEADLAYLAEAGYDVQV